ncbi:hypothetical protein C3L33_17048, partial [Rhododendron williamsianum]
MPCVASLSYSTSLQLSSSVYGQPLSSSSSGLIMRGPLNFSSASFSGEKSNLQKRFVVEAKRLLGIEEAIKIRRERELLGTKIIKRPPLRRGKVSQRLPVPDHIPKPPYVGSNLLPEISPEHQIPDSEGIACMRAACELAARVLDSAGKLVRMGVVDFSGEYGCTLGGSVVVIRKLCFIASNAIELCLVSHTLSKNLWYLRLRDMGFQLGLSDVIFYTSIIESGELGSVSSLKDGNCPAGAYPSPLGYGGFPKSVCTSVNECVCHGIPDSRQLQDGDIINIDVTVYLNDVSVSSYKLHASVIFSHTESALEIYIPHNTGYHGDTSKTFFCGNSISDSAKRLVEVTEECLHKGIAVCKDGVLFRKIGKRISEHAEQFGFGVVDRFVGHGVGTVFHSEPFIFHHLPRLNTLEFPGCCSKRIVYLEQQLLPSNDQPGRMVEGQTFTIEPILTLGSTECITWEDNWTTLTADGRLAAQFEHTILITRTGAEILTKY